MAAVDAAAPPAAPLEARTPAVAQPPQTSLYVGDLQPDVLDEDLYNAFSKASGGSSPRPLCAPIRACGALGSIEGCSGAPPAWPRALWTPSPLVSTAAPLRPRRPPRCALPGTQAERFALEALLGSRRDGRGAPMPPFAAGLGCWAVLRRVCPLPEPVALAGGTQC